MFRSSNRTAQVRGASQSGLTRALPNSATPSLSHAPKSLKIADGPQALPVEVTKPLLSSCAAIARNVNVGFSVRSSLTRAATSGRNAAKGVFPPSRPVRLRAAASLATRVAFSNCATAPRICLIKTAVGVSSKNALWLRPPRAPPVRHRVRRCTRERDPPLEKSRVRRRRSASKGRPNAGGWSRRSRRHSR
jgi:hypothetical protein